MKDLHNCIVGSIVAGAIGDAWGSIYEGKVPPFNVTLSEELFFTDDTQLTLATCEAIVEQKGIYPEGIARKFVGWYRKRRLSGMGASTLKALRDLDAGAHWALAGARGEKAAGNGAAMRVAPLAFLINPDNTSERRLFRDICRITHHNEEAYIGALAILVSIRLISEGVWNSSMSFPELVATKLPDSLVRDKLIEIKDYSRENQPHEIAKIVGSSAYVAESVPFAIGCAQAVKSKNLHDILLQVIAVGGDSDTNASMTGQIMGTYLGAFSIPNSLYRGIKDFSYVLETANKFADYVISKK